MPRIRTIKPEFFTDEVIAQMSPLARIAFEGLWCHADKSGRLEDRPARLKVLILPYDSADFEALLGEMSARRFIHRYRGGDGKAYIQIRTFEKHQRTRTDEDESKIPAPQEDTGIETIQSLQSDVVVTTETLGKERKGREEEWKGQSVSPAAPSAPSVPAVLAFPVVGKGGPAWNLTQSQVDEWSELFPGLNVYGECRKALAWVNADRGRRKTASGMARFLVGWFTRAVNSGAARTTGARVIVHQASQCAIEAGPTARDLEYIAEWERKNGKAAS